MVDALVKASLLLRELSRVKVYENVVQLVAWTSISNGVQHLIVVKMTILRQIYQND